ncbi:hypothetical protein ACHAQH_003327 [Verticillium albo-atrum]
MVEGKEMAPFIAANGQKPGWKRGSPPSKIRVPARRIRQRADVVDGGGDSSDDEAGPVRQTRRQAPATKTIDIISTRDDEDLPTPVPDLGLTNDAVEDGSDSDSGPDSPTSPTSPTNSPAATAPPPAAQPPVTLTPIRPPGPRPSPQPVNPSPPPPAAPPSPTTTPPLVLPSAAPPAAPPLLPDFSSQPLPRPNLPINDQVPEQPIAAPIEAPSTPPITVTAPPEIRTITAAPPAETITFSPSTSDSPSTISLSITSRAPALPVFDPTAPRKELEPASPTTSKSQDDIFTTSSSSSTYLITGTALPVEDSDSGSSRGRMDPNTEHALIAVGSIGSFIFASFIIWIVWRTVRRTRKKRRERDSQFPSVAQGPPPPVNKPGIGIRIAAKVPFLRNIAAVRGWHSLDDGASQPPPYEKGGRGSLRLDTDVYAGQPKFQQPSSATYSLPQTSANGTPITVSPTSMALQRNDTIRAQQGTYQSGNGTIDSIMARYGNGGDMNSTLQSTGGGLYYTESEVARQHPTDYGRPANRASAISSLSSGFGDGDIIVPGLQPPPPTSHPMRPTQNAMGRYSWVSKSGSSNRETIYTETSEDLPPRFRTVNSWVNQQTGRVKRAQGRGGDEEEDVPPVPGLPAALGKNIMPPEPQFNMMMPDGEEPRRPDDYQLR